MSTEPCTGGTLASGGWSVIVAGAGQQGGNDLWCGVGSVDGGLPHGCIPGDLRPPSSGVKAALDRRAERG